MRNMYATGYPDAVVVARHCCPSIVKSDVLRSAHILYSIVECLSYEVSVRSGRTHSDYCSSTPYNLRHVNISWGSDVLLVNTCSSLVRTFFCHWTIIFVGGKQNLARSKLCKHTLQFTLHWYICFMVNIHSVFYWTNWSLRINSTTRLQRQNVFQHKVVWRNQ